MTNDRSVREGYPLLWKDKYTVKSYDVDQEKRITLMSLFNCFQESASHHAERCDFGYKSLREKGKFWVLSRLRIEIDRLLLWEEPFTVETWSKGAQGIFALRDFLVVDSGKIAVARASSGWLVIDNEKRRPQRLNEFSETMPFLKDRHALEGSLERLKAPGIPLLDDRVTVDFCDIDLNRHANSSRYFEWILNSFPYDTLSGRRTARFDIDFLAESVYGDTISILIGNPSDDGMYLVSLKREGDERELCRARVGWV